MFPVRRSPTFGVQTALYTRLGADEALLALAKGVYDEVPEDAVLPYVVLGDAVETPDNDHTSFGAVVVVTFEIWSDYRGTREITAIAGRMCEVLDHQPLDVVGHKVIAVRSMQLQPMKEAIARIRRATQRFQVVTQQKEQ